MICPVCGKEFTPKNKVQKYCCRYCNNKAYRIRKGIKPKPPKPQRPFKLPFNLTRKVNGYILHKTLFTKLVDQGIVVEYRDYESGSNYFGLTPWYRREIYQLDEPAGFTSYVFMEGHRMTQRKRPHGQFGERPTGRTFPDSAMSLLNMKEGEK